MNAFDVSLARHRAAFALGRRERAAGRLRKPVANQHRDYGTNLAPWSRTLLASYWLGASERDRMVTGRMEAPRDA